MATTCTECGTEIDRPVLIDGRCLRCLLDGCRCVFWLCPDHPKGRVEWEHTAGDNGVNSVATCCECGRQSSRSNSNVHRS